MLKPLFKYVGGKSKMLDLYSPYFPDEIEFYVEPFVGGGSVFSYAKTRWPRANFRINDHDQDVINLYRAVRDETGIFELVATDIVNAFIKIDNYADRRKFYYDMRLELSFKGAALRGLDPERAAMFFFLIKTCFNGMLQRNNDLLGCFGTPPGALGQKKSFIDPELIWGWQHMLQDVFITCNDWRDCFAPMSNPRGLYFLDPPYRGNQLKPAYRTRFKDDAAQLELISVMVACVHPDSAVMMTNRDCGDGFFEQHLPPEFTIHQFDRNSTVGRGKKTGQVRELLITRGCKVVDTLDERCQIEVSPA